MFSTCCKLHKINCLLPSTLFTPKNFHFPFSSCFGFEQSAFHQRNLFSFLFFFSSSGLFSHQRGFLLGTFPKVRVLKNNNGQTYIPTHHRAWKCWPMALPSLSLMGHPSSLLLSPSPFPRWWGDIHPSLPGLLDTSGGPASLIDFFHTLCYDTIFQGCA